MYVINDNVYFLKTVITPADPSRPTKGCYSLA